MVKKKKYKKRVFVMKPETVVIKDGYKYVLVESDMIAREIHKLPLPCMFGMQNMALKSCTKIKKIKTKKL